MAAAARTALIAALLTALVLALVAVLTNGSTAQARKPQPTCSPISGLASPSFACPL